MAEKHPLTIDVASAAADPDWASLMETVLSDVARVFRSDIHMLQTSVAAG
jgi:hypothetical protein